MADQLKKLMEPQFDNHIFPMAHKRMELYPDLIRKDQFDHEKYINDKFHAYTALNYAFYVIKSRWIPGESHIVKFPHCAAKYSYHVAGEDWEAVKKRENDQKFMETYKCQMEQVKSEHIAHLYTMNLPEIKTI